MAFYIPAGPLRRRGFRIPRFARIGQSSLTPSLFLANANPLRWALRWGPPSAAYLGGKLQPVRPCFCAWSSLAGDSWSVIGGPVWDRPLRKKGGDGFFVRRRGGTPGPPAVHSGGTGETETIKQNKVLRQKVLFDSFSCKKKNAQRLEGGEGYGRTGGRPFDLERL